MSSQEARHLRELIIANAPNAACPRLCGPEQFDCQPTWKNVFVSLSILFMSNKLSANSETIIVMSQG